MFRLRVLGHYDIFESILIDFWCITVKDGLMYYNTKIALSQKR